MSEIRVWSKVDVRNKSVEQGIRVWSKVDVRSKSVEQEIRVE